MRTPFSIADSTIPPGTRRSLSLSLSRGFSAEDVSLPLHVIHGRRPGPCLVVTAAIHGDEVNGVAIIKRLLRRSALKGLRGTLIAVPIVNIYGFVRHERYLPDRRDLNRSFPGSSSGSLAARLARLMLDEVMVHADLVVDLHTGSLHRTNLPQIRASLDVPGVERLARAFAAPVIIDAELRPGSMRHALDERGVPGLVYEAGEALRFDEVSIRAGVQGLLSVMREYEMLAPAKRGARRVEPFLAHGTRWVRAPESGILAAEVGLGERVKKGDVLGRISNPLGEDEVCAHSPCGGIVIGHTNLPLVNEGDALFHIATFERNAQASDEVEHFQQLYES